MHWKGGASIRAQKRTRFLSLKKQLLFTMAFFIVCTVIVTAYTCLRYIRLYTSVLQNNLSLYSLQVFNSIDEVYNTCQSIAYSLSYNELVQSYLTAETPLEKYEDYSQAYNQMTGMMELSSYIKDIAILSDYGNAIAIYGAHEAYAEYLDDASLSGSTLTSLGRISVNQTDCQLLAMSIYRLNDPESSKIGTLFLAVDLDSFFLDKKAESAEYIPEYMMADSLGKILYGDEKFHPVLDEDSGGENFEMTIGGTRYLVYPHSFRSANCSLYVLINQDLFAAQGNQIATLQLGCMGILLVLVTGILFLSYRPVINSLQKLARFMLDITNGKTTNYKEGIEIDQGPVGSTEICEITNAFNSMLLHTYELNHTIFENYTHMYEMDLNNKKTEIAFLRSQINPHFLYNTLTMICGMASAGMTSEIIDTTSALSSIFRYSIKGNEMVTLEEEMEIVRSYLMIQSYRFEDRFTVTYNLAEDTLNCMIPRMVIQPIVENAIVHGLEPSLKPGTLEIGSGRNPQKGYLAVWIFDTGIGMSAEKLAHIRSRILQPVHQTDNTIMDSYKSMDSEHHESIGLLNVNSRMVLYFGEEYSIILDSEEGVGTNVQLRIPYRTAEQEVT